MAAPVSAQHLPDSTIKKIDSLFKQWDTKTSPGSAIGIVRNDSLIYAKGYGMANLEYEIPITPETIFDMASVSKQFTAFSIVLLARQGALNLDEDIHRYLSWFPDLKEKITLRNLLNHTSGIRDAYQLLGIMGTRPDDVNTQEDLIRVLTKQQFLNFKPGTEYRYSNSNYNLLAEIVKSVTGKTLRQFTDSVIFKPLGMKNTHFHDRYNEVESNRAYGYWQAGKNKDHYGNAILSSASTGPASLFSNINDMSKWIMNFYSTRAGDLQDIAQLTQKGRLNDGKELQYALGIEVDSLYGERRYQHSGWEAGYRTFISVFPDLKMGFIVFSNLGDFKPQFAANQMAGLFIKDPSPKKNPAPAYTDSSLAVLKDPAAMKKFTGNYIADDHVEFGFWLVNNKLHLGPSNGKGPALVPLAKDSFEVFTNPEVKFVFSLNSKNEKVVDEYWPEKRSRHLVMYDTTTKPDKILQTYTGTYYCPELDCNYHIVLKDHHLMLAGNKLGDIPLTLYGNDWLANDTWYMGNIMILRNRKNQITGFEVDADRVDHLWFKKTE